MDLGVIYKMVVHRLFGVKFYSKKKKKTIKMKFEFFKIFFKNLCCGNSSKEIGKGVLLAGSILTITIIIYYAGLPFNALISFNWSHGIAWVFVMWFVLLSVPITLITLSVALALLSVAMGLLYLIIKVYLLVTHAYTTTRDYTKLDGDDVKEPGGTGEEIVLNSDE